MMPEPRLYDLVALLRPLPEHGLLRGDVGAIVQIHAPGAYEVEFSRPDGSWRAIVPLTKDDCLPLRISPESPAVSGLIDGLLWYWYDPASDLLDLRLQSGRAVKTVPEPSPNGFTVLRDPVSRKAVGMVVNGYWKRFGGGRAAPSRSDLESVIRNIAPQLTAA
jgi:hypothetical protein